MDLLWPLVKWLLKVFIKNKSRRDRIAKEYAKLLERTRVRAQRRSHRALELQAEVDRIQQEIEAGSYHDDTT